MAGRLLHRFHRASRFVKMDRSARIFTTGIIMSIVFVMVGCVWLSSSVETLDAVAEQFGVSERPVWTPPISDYEVPGLGGNLVVGVVIGIAFTLLTLGVTLAVGKALKS